MPDAAMITALGGLLTTITAWLAGRRTHKFTLTEQLQKERDRADGKLDALSGRVDSLTSQLGTVTAAHRLDAAWILIQESQMAVLVQHINDGKGPPAPVLIQRPQVLVTDEPPAAAATDN